jgi:superfamily II DNA or RNA helicase
LVGKSRTVKVIERTLTPTGVHYRLAADLGAEPPRPFPLADYRPRQVDREARVLEALWVDGRLNEQDDAFVLPWEAVYDLEQVEAKALDLPASGDRRLSLEVRAVGAANAPDFSIKVRAAHPVLGVFPESSRRGPVFNAGSVLLLAPREALPLFAAVDREMPESITPRLRVIGEVVKAANACGAALDPFLATNDIVIPDAVGVEIEVVSPEEIILRPVLEGQDVQDFTRFGVQSGRIRSAYAEHVGGRHRRVILDPEQRTAAEEVRRRSTISGPDVPRFLINPEAFVPEAIDLSQFSRRVKGLIPRKYTSQPYVRANATGKDWFTISAEVELAGEIADLGPVDDRGGARTPDHGPTGERESDSPETTRTHDPVPAITPAQYAELCAKVVETGERFILHEGAWIEVDPETAEKYLRAWESFEKDEDGHLRLPRERANFVLDVIDNLEELLYDEDKERKQPGPTLPPDLPAYDVPTTLRAELMPHQLVGYRWLRFLQDRRLGGLLADDMGLGKTVQVISFLAHLADHGLLAPTLIVVPGALIENWRREIRRFCPGIHRIHEHVGAFRPHNPAEIAHAEVVLTTYQTLLRDQMVLGRVDWQVVISDEAQYVKNPTAQSTKVLKAMKAGLRLALTGTPVENGLSELWCIVDFIQPGRLGSQREFRDTFERPIRDAVDDHARLQVATRLQERLTPHYVRRLKEDVLEGLPPRKDQRLSVEMGERQREYYGAVIHSLRRGDMIPIAALQHLIMITSHPEIHKSSGATIGELVEECPKLKNTLEIVAHVRSVGEKVLIYTHYKQMQAILQELIEDRFDRHVPVINGELAGSRRLAVVDRFNERRGFAAMILGPQAAGVGLNITGANHVIHYTRLWNPAKEAQATDRAHRIGQKRPVTVYYPIVTGEGFTSVEERLDELLEEKRALARNVVWPRSRLDVSSELQSWLTGEASA